MFPNDKDLYEKLLNFKADLNNKSSIAKSKSKSLDNFNTTESILKNKKENNIIDTEKITTTTKLFKMSKDKKIKSQDSDRKPLFYQQDLEATEIAPEENKFKNFNNEMIPNNNESILRPDPVKITPINKKQLSEKEISKKIENFKNNIMKDLLKVLSEEKFKEEEREILYNKTINPIERKRLEKIISMERAISSEKILKLNE